MASVLATGNNPSIGFGQGLQAEPDTKGLDFAAQGIRMSEARKQRAAAAKKKADDEIKDLGIKAPVVHPFYQQEVNDSVRKLGGTLYNLTRSSDPDAYYKGKDAAAETQFTANKAIEGSKYLGTIEHAMEADKATGTMSPEARQAFDALRAGDKEKLSNIKDPTRRFMYDPVNQVPVYRPVPNVKTDLVETGMVKDPNYRTSVSAFQNKEYHNPKGGIEIFNIDRIPETKAEAVETQSKFGISSPLPTLEDQRDLLLQNPDFAERKSVELINSGRLPKDYYDRDVKEQERLLGMAVFKDLQAKNGAKITRNVQNPNVPRQDNSLNKEQLASSLQDKNIYKKRSGESITAYFSPALAKPITAVIPSAETEGVIDGDSFQHVKFPGITPKWNLGAPQGMVVDKKSGQPVDDDVVDRLKAKGKLTRDKYKVELFSHATGEVESPGQLSEAQKRAINSSFFPISSVRSPLQKSGVDFKEYDKAVKEKENELFGGESDKGKGDWSKYKRK